MRAGKLFAPLAFAIALASAATTPALAQKSKDTLRVGYSFPFEVIDPYYTGLREVKLVIGEMVFDTLVGRDAKTFNSVPLLATGWNQIDDLTLELDLRQGVKWHDGVPFTADDVEYTFDYLNTAANKVPNKEWYNWIERVEKVGPHKVRLQQSRPFGPALAFMSQVLPIMPKDFYGEGGTAGGNGRLVGTGPYKIANHVPQREVLLEINQDYFAGGPKGTPSIGKVLIRNLPDEATVMAELLSGGIDWMWRVAPDHKDRLAATSGLAISSGGTMRIFWLGFDVMGRDPKSPFKNAKVRRAIAHAIDRQKMADELVGTGSAVVHVMCYPTQVGCPDQATVAQYEYNPNKAKTLLAEAGYGDGFSSSVWTYAQGLNRVFLESIQGFLREVDVKLELQVTPSFSVFAEAVGDGKTPMVMESHGQYNINDVEILQPFAFNGGSRDNVKDAQVMDWIKEARATASAKREDLYKNVVRRISDQVFWLPLFSTSIIYAHSADLDFAAWGDENPRFYLDKWK